MFDIFPQQCFVPFTAMQIDGPVPYGKNASFGIKALGDRARSGKPPTYLVSDLRERIHKQLELDPPAGLSSSRKREVRGFHLRNTIVNLRN